MILRFGKGLDAIPSVVHRLLEQEVSRPHWSITDLAGNISYCLTLAYIIALAAAIFGGAALVFGIGAGDAVRNVMALHYVILVRLPVASGAGALRLLERGQVKTLLDNSPRPVRAVVHATAPREEVVDILEHYRLTDLPVVDAEARLIGVVRYRNLMAAAEDEATVAMQTLVGVSKDERALSKVAFAVRKRLPWLYINLATAFLAAAVVGLFESTIAKFTALAVLLPVVAGQSGNTGAQALAVTMRGLALRAIPVRSWPRVVFKVMSAGFWNGVTIAATTSLGVWVWSRSTGLAAVIGVSMILSMVIAGIFGAAIPVMLTAARQDPAQSSSIILTMVTDVTGFFSFLGIATLFAGFL